MNAYAADLCGAETFFAPVESGLIDRLVAEYRLQRQKIDQIHTALWDHGLGSVIGFFINGNCDGRYQYIPTAQDLFKREGAIKALNAHYWDQALKLTDVLDLMPKARRDEWFKSIREMTTPEFSDESVRATLADMLASRSTFFAERVDGIFRGLSREHVTNQPEGFGKRMILRSVVNDYGLAGSDQDYIHDLRCVIAKFMGRDDPNWTATKSAVSAARRQTGEWFPLDGGALKLRVYLKGTGHLEVHPDMAWRLNAILASLYPAAIPEQHRKPPKRKPKEVALIEKPLPFSVLAQLQDMEDGFRLERVAGWRQEYNRIAIRNSLSFSHAEGEKHARAQAEEVLYAIGGVKDADVHNVYRFDYPPRPVLDLIITSGCIPDYKSHQFYPTPEALARKAVELAEIQPGHVCLEPSAGIGNLLQFMPQDTVAVEISALHCEVLRAKGCRVEYANFMAIHRPHVSPDRIVMNPPFDQGRWLAHLEHAAGLLNFGGRLVAILPSGAKSKADLLPGYTLQWHGPFDNQFPGASVSVVILVAEKAA